MAEESSKVNVNAGLCGRMRLGPLRRGHIIARRERVSGVAWVGLGVADSFENVEPEFTHLIADALDVLDGCAMEYDPDKEKAVALSLRASLEATVQDS